MAATLTIEILANAAQAKKTLNETGSDVEHLGEKSSGMGTAMAAGAAAGLAGIVALGVGAFNAAEESAKIGRETERVIRTTGAAAWTSADQVGDLAAAISDKTGADDEAIQSGQNLLLTFTNIRDEVGEGNDVFSQATGLALDMSTALGTDMSAASIQLGKALNDPVKGITALSKAGVSFTQEQKTQIKVLQESGDILGAQKIVLAELGKEFGGAAEAAGTPLDKLKVKIGNLQEEIGAKLIPAVSGVATFIGDKMGPAISKASEFLSEHAEAVKFLATVGMTALAASYLPVIAGQVAMVATNVVGYVTQVTSAVIYAGQAFLTVAAQQGVLTASTQALNYALSASLPGLALVAVSGVIYGLISIFDRSSESADKFFDSVKRDVDTSSFDSLHDGTKKVDEEMGRLRVSMADQLDGWGSTGAAVADMLIPFHDVENSLDDQGSKLITLKAKQAEYTEQIRKSEQALFDYATNSVLAAHGMDENAKSSIAMTDANAGLNSEIGAVNEKLKAIAESKKIDVTEPGAADKVRELYEKTLATTDSTLGMTEAQKKYNDAASTAKDKVDAYKSSLDALVGIHMSAAQAETNYSKNSLGLLRTLTETRALANGELDVNKASTLGQAAAINEANSAIQGNVKAALDLANATYQETGSVDAATDALASNRQHLIDTMIQLGYSQTAAEDYVNRLGLTPDALNTQVNLDNGEANNKLTGTQGQLDKVGAGAHAVVTADTGPAQAALNEFYRRNPAFVGPLSPQQAADWVARHRASGGPVLRGQPYIVGERGPELFVPAGSGTIIPAGATASSLSSAGGTVVNNTFNVSVAHTGLGVDSPRLQRDVVETMSRWVRRNGPVPGLTGA